MVSKLTSGVLVETVRLARFNSTAAALVSKALNNGAMGAAGIPRPDKATIDSFVDALAYEAAGADLCREYRGPSHQRLDRDSQYRARRAFRRYPKETAMFRLVASCNAITHKGQVLPAWAPGANGEAFSLTTDGTPKQANRFSARPTPGLPSTFPRKHVL